MNNSISQNIHDVTLYTRKLIGTNPDDYCADSVIALTDYLYSLRHEYLIEVIALMLFGRDVYARVHKASLDEYLEFCYAFFSEQREGVDYVLTKVVMLEEYLHLGLTASKEINPS